MAKLRGPHLSTPLTLLSSDRDALLRGDPGAAAPGEDARYLVTRAGAVTLSEGEDGTLRAVLEQEDPREGAQQPLVLLGRREGYRVLAAEIGEPSAELDAPGRDLRDLRRVADQLADSDADLAAAAVAMGAWHRSMRHCPQCGGIIRAQTILFEEALDADVLDAAFAAVEACDVLIAVGTGLSVYPVAGLVPLAAEHGARTIILNAEPTPFDSMADVVLDGDLQDRLPAVLDELASERDHGV